MADKDLILAQENNTGNFVETKVIASSDSILAFDSSKSLTTISKTVTGDVNGTLPSITVNKITPNAQPISGCSVLNLSSDITLTSSSQRIQVLNPNGNDREITLPTIATSPTGNQVAIGWSVKIENSGADGKLLIIKNAAGIVQAVVQNGDAITMYAVAASDVWSAHLDPSNQPFVVRRTNIDLTKPASTRFNIMTIPAELRYVLISATIVTTERSGSGSDPKFMVVTQDMVGVGLSSEVTLSSDYLNTFAEQTAVAYAGDELQLMITTASTYTSHIIDIYCNGFYIV